MDTRNAIEKLIFLISLCLPLTTYAVDSDGDGVSDAVETFYGFNINDAASTPLAAMIQGDTFYGDSDGDYFGYSVASAGDVNGDGYADVIVGAYGDDNNGGISGSARILSGADGSILYTFNGDNTGDYFGISVAAAGDVNGDGKADVIVGAFRDDNNGADSGSARILSGADGSILYTFNGDNAGDLFGYSVAAAGDINGDGLADVIVGAQSDDNNGNDSGSTRIFLTIVDTDNDGIADNLDSDDDNDGLSDTAEAAAGTSDKLADSDGDGISDGTEINNGTNPLVNEDYDHDALSNTEEATLGTDPNNADSDGDGANDYIEVLYGFNPLSASEFPVFSLTPGATFDGESSSDYFGHSVASAGDVNDDGYADVIVGAYGDDNNGSNYGSARILSGSDGSILYTFYGDNGGDYFGHSVASVGDVNGDGKADVIVGAYLDDNNGTDSGSARIFSGADGSILYTFNGDNSGDYFGYSVAAAGDVNGDGKADVIVGAYRDDNSGANSGSARIFSGADGSILYTFNGDSANDYFGYSVAGAGDVTGDGNADVIVGAYGDDNNGTDSGSARIFSGAGGSILYTVNGDSANDSFGYSVAAAGDMNGDGVAYLVVGAYRDDNNGIDSGSGRIFSILVDTDNDGNADKLDADDDNDGLSDAAETIAGTSGKNADTDGDGILDGMEVNNGTDPLEHNDLDRDGLSNVEEASLGTDPNNADSDGDGISDGIEVSNGSNPLVNEDLDRDGLSNTQEAALGTDPNNADSDGDGANDNIEVFYGFNPLSVNEFPVFSLSTGATFDGENAGDQFGQSVAITGDVNGDGKADVIVGAYQDDNNGTDSGSAHIFSGADGSTLYIFNGDNDSDYFGASVASAGDVNGDGKADVIVGAYGDDNNGADTGSARIFSGADGSVLYTFNGDSSNDYFGRSVAGAGDVNGDGKDDLIVGAYGDDNNGSNSGSARIFSGADGSILYTFNGESTNDYFGYSVAAAGDVNGDGRADVIVGAYQDDNNGTDSGSARIFSGADGTVLYSFDGESSSDYFGHSVASAGDVNGDGYADVIVGAYGDGNNGSDSGSARIFSGANGSTLYTFSGDSANDRFGYSVAGAGDVNGDGKADVLVGAYQDDNNGIDSGSARIFSGADGSVLYTFDGDGSSDYFGYSVAAAGDVNDDVLADLVVGAFGDDNNGSNSGSVSIFHFIVDTDNDGLGDSVDTDDDDDGLSDVAEIAAGTSSKLADTDGDGISDGDEVRSGTDPIVVDDVTDTDGDGLTDLQETNLGTNINLVDSDGDGRNDYLEFQSGSDPLVDEISDNDNDGLTNLQEANLGTNPDLADTDGDGINDGVEITNGTDPLVDAISDNDGDGLTNLQEANLGTNPDLADTDGDGVNDGAEVKLGTNPTNASDVPPSFVVSDGPAYKGNGLGSSFGRSVAAAGDVNSDGYADVIVGAYRDNGNGTNSGSISVFSGADDSRLYFIDGASSGDFFGLSVSGAGDINGDGFDDFIVGAYGDDKNGAFSGSASIWSGLDGSILYTFYGDSAGDNFGEDVAAAGDVNGDGYADVMVGAPYSDANGENSGLVRVFSGFDGSILYTFIGDEPGERFGASLDGAGDVNDDGYADVIVGAKSNDNGGENAGLARIFSGVDGSILYNFYGDSAGDSLGISVARAGDVNGDGYADLIVGAFGDDNNGSNSGAARIFSGDGGSILYTFYGDDEDDLFGVSVAGAGDINGDGYSDVVVGAWGDDNNGNKSGSARIFSGVDGSTLNTLNGLNEDDLFGISVAGAGDLNNDGYADVIVGAPSYDDQNDKSGYVRIFLSSNENNVIGKNLGYQVEEGSGNMTLKFILFLLTLTLIRRSRRA